MAREERINPSSDLVLSDELFDRFIAELDKPAKAVPELGELLRRHPQTPG